MNKPPVVEIITFTKGADIEYLQTCIKRACNLMAEIAGEPMAYEGVSLDIIVSLLAYRMNCGPDELSRELRKLADALDRTDYKLRAAPRKN